MSRRDLNSGSDFNDSTRNLKTSRRLNKKKFFTHVVAPVTLAALFVGCLGSDNKAASSVVKGFKDTAAGIKESITYDAKANIDKFINSQAPGRASVLYYELRQIDTKLDKETALSGDNKDFIKAVYAVSRSQEKRLDPVDIDKRTDDLINKLQWFTDTNREYFIRTWSEYDDKGPKLRPEHPLQSPYGELEFTRELGANPKKVAEVLGKKYEDLYGVKEKHK